MDKIEKFLNKLMAAQRRKLEALIIKVVSNKLDDLNYKKLKGFETLYRVRVGKIRIVFEMGKNANKIINIDYRKDVYR